MENHFKTGIIPRRKGKAEDYETEIESLEYRKFIIDVSRPHEPIQELDFMNYNSELCI
jgi:hypothetical protein